MPLPSRLAKFNKRVSNKLMRPVAARLGGFAVLHHTGRRSETPYETPLNVFRHGDEIVVALTYGSDVDWLKNTKAAERSVFVISGEKVEVGPPAALSRSDGYERVPGFVKIALAGLGVDEFVVFPVLPEPQSAQDINTLPDSAD